VHNKEIGQDQIKIHQIKKKKWVFKRAYNETSVNIYHFKIIHTKELLYSDLKRVIYQTILATLTIKILLFTYRKANNRFEKANQSNKVSNSPKKKLTSDAYAEFER